LAGLPPVGLRSGDIPVADQVRLKSLETTPFLGKVLVEDGEGRVMV
jgi:hypothetical protein